MAFVMRNFKIWGLGGVGKKFSPKSSKSTSLADFTSFEPLCVQIHSRVLLWEPERKKGHYKKSHIGREFHTQPNSTKIGI